MRALLERVDRASVTVEGEVIGKIERGLLVYVGVESDDGEQDVEYIAEKIRNVRIFADEAGKMNLDVVQAGGKVLAISAFTLQADARKGRRPSFDRAGDPVRANALYLKVVDRLRATGLEVHTGKFAAHMTVESTNNGPICLLLDSRRMF